MKLASYRAPGKTGVDAEPARLGIVVENGIVDLTARLKVFDLRSLLEGDLSAVAAAASAPSDCALDEVTLLAPLASAAKILCIGLNYEKHRIETNSPVSAFPQVFTRFHDSIVGHAQALCRPHCSDSFDFEGELAVIIGKRGRYIPDERALEHVAAYACFNEGSIREWQRHTTQVTPGKNFPRSGAFGPWLTTADEVGDPHTLRLTTRLNGKMVQDDTTDSLIFGIPQLISYCSSFTPLAPGDVIVTGTPSGVGARRSPPLFMQPGDTVEVEISRLGCLRNTIEREPE